MPREHKIHIFELTCNVFSLYKHTDDGVFDDFPKISEDFLKLFRKPDERSRKFSENFRKFPNMSDDSRRLPQTFEEDPKMFRWCTNEFKYNLTDKLDISEIIDIFTCEDIITSDVRISQRFYQFGTTRYTTFIIINGDIWASLWFYYNDACMNNFPEDISQSLNGIL